MAALPWASNSGCADDWPGTRDADVSVQLVPFGLVRDYVADATGPAETKMRAPGVTGFVAWLVGVGAVVVVGLRRRAMPAARGLVSGVCVLGLFGFLDTSFEMSGAMALTVLYGAAVPALVDLWLWPVNGRWLPLIVTAFCLSSAVIAVWFVPGLMGADVLASGAAAATAALCSRLRITDPDPVTGQART